MTDQALRIAVAAEYKKFAGQVEKDEKAKFIDGHLIGTRSMVVSDAVDEAGNPIPIGAVAIKKPPKATTELRIDDESQVLAWALEVFGEDVLEEIPATVRLTPQGRTSVLKFAEGKLLAAEKLPDGIVLSPGTPRPPSVSWTPERGVDAGKLIADMAARGVIDVNEILALPAPEPEQEPEPEAPKPTWSMLPRTDLPPASMRDKTYGAEESRSI